MKGRTATVQVLPATSSTIETVIETVGSIETPNKALISPKTTGRIESITVREGDKVTQGQVLVKIDPSELEGEIAQRRSAVAEARSRYAQAQLGQNSSSVAVSSEIEQQRAVVTTSDADYKQIRSNYESVVTAAKASVTDAESTLRSSESSVKSALAELARDNANLENALSRLRRVESLLADGFISVQEVENARTAAEVQRANINVSQNKVESARQDVISAQAKLVAAKEQLGATERKGQADIIAARARLTQAQANLRVAQANTSQNSAYRQNLAALSASVQAAEAQLAQSVARQSETQLRSPIDGIVTERNADVGSLASPGSPVLAVQSVGWLFVRSSLPIETSGSIFVGQRVNISIDAVPNTTFPGTISNVNPAADPNSRQFGVLVRLNNSEGKLRPGMFGKLKIVTQSVNASVTIPREALNESPDGKVTVSVVGEDMVVSVREVTLGVQNDKVAEVRSGVKLGEKVVVLAYDSLKDGQKVQLPKAPGEGRQNGQDRGSEKQGKAGGPS